MAFEDIKFPVFRRYKNGRNYFKFINPDRFIEVQLFGSQKNVREVHAIQFPEKAFIRDMIYDYEAMAEIITESEFNMIIND